MSKTKYLIQFELTFTQSYSLKEITEYAQDKLKVFWTPKNIKVSEIK